MYLILKKKLNNNTIISYKNKIFYNFNQGKKSIKNKLFYN